MKLDKYLYCEECGCEMRQDEDVAFSGSRIETLPGPCGEEVEVTYSVCHDCVEDHVISVFGSRSKLT
ncbi:MAG TPA: hypothetical protein HPP41_03410 [Deltaproteobacteria bacterium]|nr:hypothetical protein [Deltaproteobacteria bacterium]